MKGLVKVYETVNGSPELIHYEDNLIVDQASEIIIDLLSTPSSVSVFNDISSTVVQGFATAKGTEGYKNNLHKLKSFNLIKDADNVLVDQNPAHLNAVVTQSFVDHPDPSCKVYRAETLFQNGGAVSLRSINGVILEEYTNTIKDKPLVFGIDVKLNVFDPITADNFTDNWQPFTVGVLRGGNAYVNTIKLLHPDFAIGNDLDAGSFLEFFEGETQGNTMSILDLGQGWYRLFCYIPPVSTGSADTFAIIIYPTSSESVTNLPISLATSLKGSVFLARPMLTVGNLPIDVFAKQSEAFTSSIDLQEQPVIASSVLVGDHFLLSEGGTLTSSVSSYDVVASLPSAPDPQDVALEKDIVTGFDSISKSLYDISIDHNPNYTGYINKIPLSSIFSNSVSSSSEVSSLMLSGEVGFLGCYTPSSGAELKLVSGISAPAYENPVATFTCVGASSFNNSGSPTMDRYGFARVYYPHLGESVSGNCKVECIPDTNFSSTCQITYKISISSHERKFINAYGGIFKIGLYVVDNKQMSGVSFDKDPVDGDRLYYKLFAEKSFLFDITHQGDYGTTSGFEEERDLTIYWTIDFS